MNVGDLVIRKIEKEWSWAQAAAKRQRAEQGPGIILSKQMAGTNPVHPCITVLYPKTGYVYDIAESLVEVLGDR